MRYIFLAILSLSISYNSHSQSCTAISNGDWDDSDTWEDSNNPGQPCPCNDGYPGSTSTSGNNDCPEIVIIPAEYNVSISGTTIYYDGEIHLYGILTFQSQNGNVNGMGRLVMDSESVVKIAQNADIRAINPGGNQNGNADNNYIVIGDNEISGSEINNLEEPNQLTEVTLGSGVGCAELKTCPADPLPITLLNLDFKFFNNTLLLKWATASEENFDYFTIERSADAKNYEVIATVTGNGWSDKILHYSYIDHAPLIGRAYYRLKSTDFDGTFEYFTPIMVNNDKGQKVLRLSSNPVGEGPLTFRTNFNPANELYISITDLSGVEVFKGTLDPGLSQYTIEKQLEKGMYLLKVSTGNEHFTARFLKK